jgi:hypothetical protein
LIKVPLSPCSEILIKATAKSADLTWMGPVIDLAFGAFDTSGSTQPTTLKVKKSKGWMK